MEHGLLSRAIEYINRQRQKRRWQKVVTAMAAVVVFCTTYALILPAITLENQVFCGQEAHLHDGDCYGQVLTCELPEAEVHTHTDGCYQTDSTLVCTLSESAGHTHTDACRATETHLTCTSTEEGHQHGDGCYTTTTEVVCGLEESAGHTHGESCWQRTKTLICTQSTEVPEGGHIHSEACYGTSQEPTCGMTEHEHEDACYVDLEADRETAAQWERTFSDVELTGEFPTDVLAIAETQLGYTESKDNYIKNDEGRKLGYSRYGAWYGDPYGDWCAMFVSFCLHYGEVPDEAFPLEANCQRWIDDLDDLDLYQEAGDYVPKPGDLIFFNWDEEADSDHVGLVEEITLDEEGNYKEIKTIEGNSSNRVQRVTYDWGDSSIMGYGDLGEAYRLWLEKQAEEPGEEPAEEVEEPEEEKQEPLTLTFENDQLTLTATLQPGTELPADVELVVEDIQPDSPEADYESHYRQAKEVLGLRTESEDQAEAEEDTEEPTEEGEMTDFRLYDISIQSQGEKLAPETPVALTLTVPPPEEPEEEAGIFGLLRDVVSPEEPAIEVSLLHFAEDAEEGPIVQTLSEEDSGDLTATFDLRNDGLDAVVLAATRSADGQITVLFDGQFGAHKYYSSSNIKYAGAERRLVYADNNGYVTLPDSLTSTGNYDFQIIGWYDIINEVYYGRDMLGKQVQVTADTVFYPDYIAATYDIGQPSSSVVDNQPDTRDFITTYVFDYNELFNLQSATYTGGKPNLKAGNDRSLHTGNWSLDTSGPLGGFVFSDWIQKQSADGSGDGNIGRVNNLGDTNSSKGGTRSYSSAGAPSFAGTITPGLLTEARRAALFTTSDTMGREYVGEGDWLYSYNADTGYYYYNSALNAASYNQSQQRFYVYQDTTRVDNEATLNDFLPFNYGKSVYAEKGTEVNFWFGMQTDITFYLPDTVGGGKQGQNKAANGDDMQFRFSGDDDVWVYVDGQLVLDMGGVHDIVYGEINFATGQVKVAHNGAANSASAADGFMPGVSGNSNVSTTTLPQLAGGQNHTLTIYYLERGSSLSNCAVYFNIAPTYEMEILKKDKENGQLLAGATFTVYDDETCLRPATLHTMEADGTVGSQISSVFTTDETGKALLWGLNPGRTYYIKETSPPPGYPSMSGITIQLDLSAAGEATVLLLDSTGTEWIYAEAHRFSEDGHRVVLDVYNQEDFPGTNEELREVYVEKVWADGNTSGEITVHLYANGQDTGRSMTLNAQHNWKGVFYHLPVNDANGNPISYTVREYPIPKGYQVYYEETSGSLKETGTGMGWAVADKLEDGGIYLLIDRATNRALYAKGNNGELMDWGSADDALSRPPDGNATQWTATRKQGGIGEWYTLRSGNGYYLKLYFTANPVNFYVNRNSGWGQDYTDAFQVEGGQYNTKIFTSRYSNNTVSGNNGSKYYFTDLKYQNGKSQATTNAGSAGVFTLYQWKEIEVSVDGEAVDGWRITNRPIPEGSYQLPETGGPGAHWYILGGILLITGGTLWYRKQDDGKEGTRTS